MESSRRSAGARVAAIKGGELKTAFAILILFCQCALGQTSYFNLGLLRQGNAYLDRVYLGISSSNVTIIAGTGVTITTNIPNNSWTINASGTIYLPGNNITFTTNGNQVTISAITPGTNSSGLYGGTHVAHGLTNSNILTPVFTNTIAGGAVGSNGTLRLSFMIRARDVNGATFTIKWGGTQIWSSGPGFTAAQPMLAMFQINYWNRHSQTLQTSLNSSGTASFGTFNNDQTEFAVDTSVNQDLVFYCKNGANSATTNSWEAIDIEVLSKN